MKKVRVMAMMIFVIIAITGYTQTSISATVGAKIVVPVTAVEKEQLKMGKVAARSGNGIVKISPQNERETSGNVFPVDDQFKAGKFIISGAPSCLVSIMLPYSEMKMFLNKGNVEIGTVKFSSSVPQSGQIINPSGKIEINIGATMQVGKQTNMPSGVAEVIYELIFIYN